MTITASLVFSDNILLHMTGDTVAPGLYGDQTHVLNDKGRVRQTLDGRDYSILQTDGQVALGSLVSQNVHLDKHFDDPAQRHSVILLHPTGGLHTEYQRDPSLYASCSKGVVFQAIPSGIVCSPRGYEVA
nr:unnamed protein product [Spirometra erinaceieuropaei]